MKTTLKQISDRFETYVSEHTQLSGFVDDIVESFVSSNYTYPLMWFDTGRLRPNFETGELRIEVDCYFLDIINNNLSKIISDQLLNASDFYTIFSDNEEDFGFYISNTSNCMPVFFEFDDDLGGMKMTITIQVGESRNENQVPKS